METRDIAQGSGYRLLPKKGRWGIPQKLALVVGLSGILPVLLLGVVVYVNLRSYVFEETREKLSISVEEVARSAQTYITDLGEHARLVRSAVESMENAERFPRELRGAASSSSDIEIRSRIRSLLASNAPYSHIRTGFSRLAITDMEGAVFVSTDQVEESFRHHPLKNAISPERDSSRADAARLLIYHGNAHDSADILIAIPLFSDSFYDGDPLALVGTVAMEEFKRVLASSVLDQTHAVIRLLSPEGVEYFDLHINAEETEVRHTITYDARTLWGRADPFADGPRGVVSYRDEERKTQSLAAYTWSPELSSWIVVDVAQGDILGVLPRATPLLFLALLSSLLIGALFLVFTRRIFMRPIMDIISAIRSLDHGDPDAADFAPIPIFARDQLGELASAFNVLVERMRESHWLLEETVREKTRALEENLKEYEERNEILDKTKTATLNVLEDAVETKNKLEIQRNELETIISSIGEGLIMVDPDYVITLANPTAAAMLGFSAGELAGKKAYEVVKVFKDGKEMPREERPIARILSLSETVSFGVTDNCSIETVGGKRYPISFFGTPLLVGEKLRGAVAVFRDITADKELDEAKSSFISVASHQLRTPLTSIRWYSEMLLSEDAGPLNEMQRDFAKEVNEGTLRLYSTIDLLLSLSRIENGTLKNNPENVNIVRLAGEVADELRPQLEPKHLTLSIIPPSVETPDVHIDPLIVRQVALNLVSNAIRYTNEHGIIEFRIEKRPTDVLCAVKDNGIGISESEKPKIFSKFFRAENAIRQVPDGSGLGLSLVKGLVESWGGTIWFESEEGRGTTFFFTIPEHPIAIKMS